MSYGFRSVTDTGVVQLDENQHELCVVESGVGAATEGEAFGWSNALYAGTYTYPPLVFVRPHAYGTWVGAYAWGSQTIPSFNGFGYCASGAFDWKAVSSENVPAPSGSFGLQIWDSTGASIYDTRKGYMAVKNVFRFYEGGIGDRVVACNADGPWFCINNLALNPFFGEFDAGKLFVARFNSAVEFQARCVDPNISAAFPAADSFYATQFSPIVVMTAKF